MLLKNISFRLFANEIKLDDRRQFDSSFFWTLGIDFSHHYEHIDSGYCQNFEDFFFKLDTPTDQGLADNSWRRVVSFVYASHTKRQQQKS